MPCTFKCHVEPSIGVGDSRKTFHVEAVRKNTCDATLYRTKSAGGVMTEESLGEKEVVSGKVVPPLKQKTTGRYVK